MEMGGDAALQSGADVEAVVVSWLRNIEAVFKIMVSCAGARSPMEGGGPRGPAWTTRLLSLPDSVILKLRSILHYLSFSVAAHVRTV